MFIASSSSIAPSLALELLTLLLEGSAHGSHMTAEQTEFTCVCSQKTLILGDREQVQREQAEKAAKLIHNLALEGETVVLPGGGFAAQGAQICEAKGYAAAFIG